MNVTDTLPSTVPVMSETGDDPMPRSTCRLQISADFTLADARAVVPYLHRLGVHWVYLSPLLAAEPGSDHGYDVVDPARIDPARGTEEDLAALSATLREHDMGLLLDIVPNHMGVATPRANPAWWDLLTHGPGAESAAWFDVDWERHHGRVLIPVLGDGTAEDPEAELAHLRVDEATGTLRYWEHEYPLASGTLERAREQVDARPHAEAGADADESRLARAVHDLQHYRLAPWRLGDAELNYRRFFTITTLAGVRVEDPKVFDAMHERVRSWVERGWVQGLRVDHPDGLRSPGGYLRRVRERVLPEGPLYVEKILESALGPAGERLPAAWPTEGTTGYDALGDIERVLMPVAAAGPAEHDEQKRAEWARLTVQLKREVALGQLAAETRRLVRELRSDLDAEAGVAPPHALATLRDAGDQAVAEALAWLMAHLPVYRTYLPLGAEHLEAARRGAIEDGADAALVDALAAVAVARDGRFAARLQQSTGMVMAKGVEDRAFYRYCRWANLNEVGADPSHVHLPAAQFHARQHHRQAAQPHAMTALSTHDTKRGEDTRARIAALSEHHAAWTQAAAELERLHPLGDKHAARLLWQSVVGVWPTDGTAPEAQRLIDYALKAAREAGVHTTWTDPDAEHERLLTEAMRAAAAEDTATRRIIQSLADTVAASGLANQLAATLLQLTVPGVPDLYQGTELPAPCLVDPDNRREVDFTRRAALLEQLDADLAAGRAPVFPVLADGQWRHPGPEGQDLAKLAVTAAGLRARRDRPELFTGHRALDVVGPAAEHVLAFDRGGAVTIVLREPERLARSGGLQDTSVQLPAGPWVDAVTGRRLGSGGAPEAEETGWPVAALLAAGPIEPHDAVAEGVRPVAMLLPADGEA